MGAFIWCVSLHPGTGPLSMKGILLSLLACLLVILAADGRKIDLPQDMTDLGSKDETKDWSPDPCFPDCTTDSALTSPDPSRHCIKTDCFDEPLCAEMCAVINHCGSYEWVLNNDDNDIFGETWCAVDGYGMCYCCDC